MQSMLRCAPRGRLVFLALPALLLSCQAEVGQEVVEEAPASAPPRLRRVVGREIDHVFSALLDDRWPVSDRLPAPATAAGFVSISGVQVVDEQLVSGLLEAATGAVDRTWKRDRTGFLRLELVAGALARTPARLGPTGTILWPAEARARLGLSSAPDEAVTLHVDARWVPVPGSPVLPGTVTRPSQARLTFKRGALPGDALDLLPDGVVAQFEGPLPREARELEFTCVVDPGSPAEPYPGDCEIVDAYVTSTTARLGGEPLLRVCDPEATPDCTGLILDRFAQRAWGLPLGVEQRDRLLALAAESATDPDAGARAMLVAMVASPRTLFVNASAIEEQGAGYAVASALSHLLTEAPPDEALLAAAAAGRLGTAEGVRAEAARLMETAEISRYLSAFASQWLGFTGLPRNKRFGLSLEVRDSMKEEGARYLLDALRERRPVSSVVDADWTFADPPLAEHYGLPASASDGFLRRELAGSTRAGLVTLGGAMAATGREGKQAATARGLWLLSQLLCDPPPPPPPGIQEIQPDPNAQLLTQFQQHASNPACASCHTVMDPIGLVLSSFDGTGRALADPTKVVGSIEGTWRDGTKYKTAQELARLVAKDSRFTACFVRQLFTHALGRTLTDTDEATLTRTHATFLEGGQRLDQLLLDVVASDEFRRVVELHPEAP